MGHGGIEASPRSSFVPITEQEKYAGKINCHPEIHQYKLHTSHPLPSLYYVQRNELTTYLNEVLTMESIPPTLRADPVYAKFLGLKREMSVDGSGPPLLWDMQKAFKAVMAKARNDEALKKLMPYATMDEAETELFCAGMMEVYEDKKVRMRRYLRLSHEQGVGQLIAEIDLDDKELMKAGFWMELQQTELIVKSEYTNMENADDDEDVTKIDGEEDVDICAKENDKIKGKKNITIDMDANCKTTINIEIIVGIKRDDMKNKNDETEGKRKRMEKQLVHAKRLPAKIYVKHCGRCLGGLILAESQD